MTATLSSEVAAAAERIRPYVRRTPVLRTEFDGRPLVLKLEHLQRTGSFKLRGALNALLSGPRPEQVVTASGGNHGIGVATAASILGLRATVYAPESIPASKAVRIEETGARLVRVGNTYAEAAAAAHEVTDARYVEAYDDPVVIAGQGTVAAEIVEDVPEVDTIAVAVGGGGLAAGLALGSAGRLTVAVEPEHCDSLNRALEAGEPVAAETTSIASSALGATRVGRTPFDILTSHPLHALRVPDDEILAARDLLWHEFRLAVEPAAATAFAAWLANRLPGDLPAIVLCGANSEWQPL
ncbi:threonine dehydratase [Amycolatopsis bartoniae]|uniref:Serine/threonine dehydratase n=1 Tax=Amycolatopsis bartoniae TaxID=941986 RepID=A0A8H9IYN4_9PSEU|nr:serine/threonine dehydratase [Amycolatopsis bartoniae]MBB2933266.1 threonine dehydratase [Amycolatopsis bartoniae]TVS99345.1 pyridoxal-phosphate dependent enzyme [Amycolatopsis bartoniae]GHF58267.1 serine/threonine dehydratase [Amycolatopsis bartoniae]